MHAVCALYVGTLESRGTVNLGSGDDRIYPLGRVPTGIKRKRSVLDMMKMQSSSSPIAKGSADAKEVKKIAADKAKTKSPIIDVTQPAFVGTKRAGSSTMHSFFSKSPKKAAAEEHTRIIG